MFHSLTSIAAESNPPPLLGWTLDWSKDSMPFCLPSVLEWKSTQAPFSTLGALQGGLAFCLGLCGTSPFVELLGLQCRLCTALCLLWEGIRKVGLSLPLLLGMKGSEGNFPCAQTSQQGSAWQAALCLQAPGLIS